MRLHNFGIGAALLCCATASFAAERITVDQAVQMALKGNLRLASVEKRAGSSHDQALATGARLLPSVHLSEEFQHWDCPAAFDLANFAGGAECLSTINSMPKAGAPDLSAFTAAQQQQLGSLLSAFSGPPIIARKQDTNSFVASIDQPIVGLLHTGYDYAASRATASSVDAGVKASQAAVVQLVRTGYLQYFEARALEQIAAASVAELADQVKVNEARLKAGVITNADLLRVTVARANARQQQIAAHAQGLVARANLLDAIGLTVDTDVEFEEPTTLLAGGAVALPDAESAMHQALQKRPEVAQTRLAEKSAEHNRSARYLSLLPEVDAEGAYVRTDGQLFAPANQWFVGVKATWAIWEWGATFFQARAAAHQAEASAIDAENERRQVTVEVTNARANTEAFGVSVDVAHEAISSAQEAYRVTQALVQAGSATTTDLLESQSALTTARLNLARAQYELAIQRVALSRVMGD
jgi:outer membrane protein TolC